MSTDQDEKTKADAALFDKAVGVVLRCGRISVSEIQRHCGLGYSRAADLAGQIRDLVQALEDGKG